MTKKITFGFIVGGDDKYYNNLMRACESLERIKQPHEVLIIDMDDRLSIDEPNVKIVKVDAEELHNDGDDRNYFQPYIWKERYNLYKYLETDYCFYMDTDTVVINDRVDELIEEAGHKFLCTQHWWVPTLKDYFATGKIDKTNMGPYLPHDTGEYDYIASGAFMFQKEKHDGMFRKYDEIFREVFSDGKLHSGVTDELILCFALNECMQFMDNTNGETNGFYHLTNGAFNHCAAHDYMPMEKRKGIWYGSNPQDDEMKPVFLFHSAAENVATLGQYGTNVKELKKVMYWEDYK